jgi:hypothetical protein
METPQPVSLMNTNDYIYSRPTLVQWESDPWWIQTSTVGQPLYNEKVAL